MDLAVNKVPDTTKWKNMAEKKGAIFGRKTRVFLVHEVEVWTRVQTRGVSTRTFKIAKVQRPIFGQIFYHLKKKFF